MISAPKLSRCKIHVGNSGFMERDSNVNICARHAWLGVIFEERERDSQVEADITHNGIRKIRRDWYSLEKQGHDRERKANTTVYGNSGMGATGVLDSNQLHDVHDHLITRQCPSYDGVVLITGKRR